LKFKLRLFASFRQTFGTNELEYELPDGSTANDLVEDILEKYPSLDKFRGHVVVTRNREAVPLTTPIHEGEEIAILPPVSGG